MHRSNLPRPLNRSRPSRRKKKVERELARTIHDWKFRNAFLTMRLALTIQHVARKRWGRAGLPRCPLDGRSASAERGGGQRRSSLQLRWRVPVIKMPEPTISGGHLRESLLAQTRNDPRTRRLLRPGKGESAAPRARTQPVHQQASRGFAPGAPSSKNVKSPWFFHNADPMQCAEPLANP